MLAFFNNCKTAGLVYGKKKKRKKKVCNTGRAVSSDSESASHLENYAIVMVSLLEQLNNHTTSELTKRIKLLLPTDL